MYDLTVIQFLVIHLSLEVDFSFLDGLSQAKRLRLLTSWLASPQAKGKDSGEGK